MSSRDSPPDATQNQLPELDKTGVPLNQFDLDDADINDSQFVESEAGHPHDIEGFKSNQAPQVQ